MPYYTDDIISYPLFADADTGIYPHAAPRYHARPKAKRGIAVLSVDKFPYPRQPTGGNEFIPCSNVWNLFKVLKSCFEVKPISIAQRNIYEEQPAIVVLWRHTVAHCYCDVRYDVMYINVTWWRVHSVRSRGWNTQKDNAKHQHLIQIKCSSVKHRGKYQIYYKQFAIAVRKSNNYIK